MHVSEACFRVFVRAIAIVSALFRRPLRHVSEVSVRALCTTISSAFSGYLLGNVPEAYVCSALIEVVLVAHSRFSPLPTAHGLGIHVSLV